MTTRGLVYHTMCLFTPPAFTGYSLCLPMEGWLRLSRPGCQVLCRDGIHPNTVTHPGTNWAWNRVTTLIVTNKLSLNQTSYLMLSINTILYYSAIVIVLMTTSTLLPHLMKTAFKVPFVAWFSLLANGYSCCPNFQKDERFWSHVTKLWDKVHVPRPKLF